MNEVGPVEIDGLTGEVTDLPPQGKRYRAKLDTIGDVRREMSRVYRECRTGVLATTEGSKLTWMLERIGNVIQSSDLETRVENLERQRNDT